MNHSTEPGHKQIEPGSQPRPEIPLNPTVQQMKGGDKDELLQWIQRKRPNLLSGDNLEKFIAAKIPGEAFLWGAGDKKIFMDNGLLAWVSEGLAILSHEVKEGGEFIPWTQLRHPTNSVKGNLSNQTADTKRMGKNIFNHTGYADSQLTTS
jgi:hypothetical protein